ncbi:MAG: hypothetical protein R3B95_03470 [Nitrospirales bacterium]|nr:hypothetical protein [Nitrospirales bacterium]
MVLYSEWLARENVVSFHEAESIIGVYHGNDEFSGVQLIPMAFRGGEFRQRSPD